MIFKKIINFLRSLWWHIWLGFPKSTPLQILDRYAICEACEEFDPKGSQCLVCGCSLSKKKNFMNKLAWADQKCPIGKWPSLINKG